ncbi:VCBS repeat-containing protein [Streptomyces sp. NBC_00250]|uniref:hypothetical protein n=1 Tax=Streptomyces sp. NBC_00250 TaxID=2903641 RepID=UPI002E29F490|nr:hypothetical protein [Streptomyces sp. NBC_00250]
MNHYISGLRLAAALLTLTTVTGVTGTLVTAPAVAAPTDAEGRCAPTAPGLLPVAAEIVSTGAYGYVTTCTDENGATALEWHKNDGTVSPLGGPYGYDSVSDYIVTGDGSRLVAYHPATSTYVNHSVGTIGSGAEVVGVAGSVLYVSVPTTGVGRELWQLENVNGVVRKTKLSNPYRGETETGHKVVAAGKDANGRPVVLILGKGLRDTGGDGGPAPYAWRAVVPVVSGTVIDPAWMNGSAVWNAAATGALTSKYEAWTTNVAGSHQLVVRGSGIVRNIPLGDIPGQPVLAGIVGDSALYATQRDPLVGPEALTPLYARNVVTGAARTKLLVNYSSVAHAADGSLLVRGATTESDGLFRITEGLGGTPTVTLVAETGRVLGVEVTESKVPTAVNLEKPVSTAMEWALSRGNARVDLTLTHNRSGRKQVTRLTESGGPARFAFSWDGLLNGASAPNGAYSWQLTAAPLDGVGAPATASGGFTVSRQANPHDFTDNGSGDLLARDASGVLWSDDLFDWPVNGQAKPAKRTKIGPGWNTYKQIEAVGNIGGGSDGDLIALDGSGVLWNYLGKGDGTFTTRYRIGGGWGGYTRLAGGSDLGADGKADLFAVDTAGFLWRYLGTGDAAKPYGPRVRMGGGWGVYNQLTAVGDIAGDAGGDLVARDKDGVLWLYPSNDHSYSARVRVGGGWGGFSQLVGAGDVTNDGRPDLIAYGPAGTYVYRSTGSATAPFSRQSTSLYAGEGTKYTNVS